MILLYFLIFIFIGRSICGYFIEIGNSIEKLVKRKQIYPFELQLLTHMYKDRKYMLLTNMKHKTIHVCLDENYSSSDVLEAYFHAVFHGICASYITKDKLVCIFNCGNSN